jgi:hypothetical protein
MLKKSSTRFSFTKKIQYRNMLSYSHESMPTLQPNTSQISRPEENARISSLLKGKEQLMADVMETLEVRGIDINTPNSPIRILVTPWKLGVKETIEIWTVHFDDNCLKSIKRQGGGEFKLMEDPRGSQNSDDMMLYYWYLNQEQYWERICISCLKTSFDEVCQIGGHVWICQDKCNELNDHSVGENTHYIEGPL